MVFRHMLTSIDITVHDRINTQKEKSAVKKYEAPEIEIVVFATEDVITTSSLEFEEYEENMTDKG